MFCLIRESLLLMCNVQISLSVQMLDNSWYIVYIYMFVYTFMQMHISNCTFALIFVYSYGKYLTTLEEVASFKMFNERHKTVWTP